MDTQQIRSFLSILKTGSFSQAAKLTYRSQPAVSRQIKALEEELGTRLFERFGPMKVKATADGLALKEIVSPLLDNFDSVKKRFDEQRGLAGETEISIATHESVLTYFFPDIVADFMHKHPKLKLTFFRKTRREIIDMVAGGEVDFGVTSLEKGPPGLHFEAFATYKHVLIVPKGHPLSKNRDIKPKDIAEYPLILAPTESRTRRTIDEVFKKQGLTYRLFLEVMSRESAKIYVSKGLGISIMSEFYLLESDRKNIDSLDVSKYFGTTSRGLLYRKGKALMPVHQELVRRITER